jgi:hypothetical protein
MELNIDLSGKELVVTKNPEPKLDHNGVQRPDKQTGDPIWSTQVVVTDHTGGEVIKIATKGEAGPDVEVGDEVEVTRLVAIPWATNGRSGIAYRADRIKAL